MEKYEFLSRTGEGAYGSVWRARDKNTGTHVAVKKMKDVPTTEEEGEIAMREVRVLQLAKHVNIVNLLEAYKSQSGRLYLVFEYVERTLLHELKANRSGMAPAAVKSISWQLLQALGYLHRKQIIHRDVKPSNILITDGGVLKICDFGFARACSNTASDPAYTTYVVTRWYRPPEVLVGDTYGPPVDIWALGCIFAEMLMGRPLFPGKNHHDQLWLILKCLGTMTERQLDLLDADPQFACFRLPTHSEVETLDQRVGNVGPAAMQVLRACLDPDPKQRATADELLAMPYFQGVTQALPVEDLSAYPDPEMRSRLERALAQDQATVAAAAAREVTLLMHSGRRVIPAPGKPPQHSMAAAGAASPTRLALQQLQQQGSVPLPSKAATSSKLEPSSEPQRPPLQRHITAPAGTMSVRVNALQLPLQPMPDHYGPQYLLPQRSRPGSESSQQNSPKAQQAGSVNGSGAAATVLGPVRGRSSWRISGDGAGECGGPQPPARQVCGAGLQPQTSVLTGTAANGSALADSGRLGPDQPAHTLRPAHQRATWNGSAAPRSNGGTGSTGGGSSGGAANNTTASPFFSSSLNYNHSAVYDMVAVHRKAHSLAGNEAMPPTATAPMGIRGAAGVGGVQGRSLAPPLGAPTASGSNSAPSGAGFQLPPSQFGFPTTAIIHRLTPSPPPGGYGSGLRGASSAPLGPTPGSHQGRGSQDGSGGPNGPQPNLTAPGKQQHGPGVVPAVLDCEPSESSLADAHYNDGRRASDTVLYAAAALREGKNRIDKAAHAALGPARQQLGLLDGPAGAPAGGSGGGAQGLGVLRTPSFSRSSAPSANEPPSPEAIIPGNLPPLQGTPQRRISMPESAAIAVIASGGALGPGGGAATSRVASAASQPTSGIGYTQRQGLKQQQGHTLGHGHGAANGNGVYQPNVGELELADGTSSAHVVLPVLDVGYSGKTVRVPSAGTGPNVGVGVARRPSKGSLRIFWPDAHCKREEAPKALLLEAVPEASVL